MKDLESLVKNPLTYVIILVVIGLFVYHFTYVKKQGFESKILLDTSKQSMFPYTTEPINSLDQYEIEAVFDNEGDKELRQTDINRATRRYPLDWTNYPPNASKFQSGQAKYVEGFSTNASAQDLEKPYQNIGAGNLTPPDTLELEKEERQILQTYQPKNANSLTTYEVEDAQALIDNIYKKKGISPVVARKEGNVFEVVSTRQIGGKIEYEDDLPMAPTSAGANQAAGEAVINVPAVATETAAGLDPFYEPTTATRSDRSDYTKWTPGLERMFAPTYPVTDWIGQPRD